MKKLLLLFFLVSPLWADGPKYAYPDPRMNDEMHNIYHDLKYINAVTVKASTGTFIYINVSSITARTITTSSITAPSLTVTNINGAPYAAPSLAGKIYQIITSTTSTTTLNTTVTYIDTALTATITPSAATSKIVVMSVNNVTNGTTAETNIKHQRTTGAVDLTSRGVWGIPTSQRGMITLIDVDSPNSTSAITYRVRIANRSGTGTAVHTEDPLWPGTMTLIEVTQ